MESTISKMEKPHLVSYLVDLIQDWREGELTGEQGMMVLNQLFSERTISDKALEWARRELHRLGIK